MQNSKSLRNFRFLDEDAKGILCETCIVKQIIENADASHWPDGNGKWSHYVPDVEESNCIFVQRLLAGTTLRDDDKERLKKCEKFLPQIAWVGLRKSETVVIQELYEFIFLSIGIKPDIDALVDVFQEVRQTKAARITLPPAGTDITTQFGFERANYNLLALVRDAFAEIHNKN